MGVGDAFHTERRADGDAETRVSSAQTDNSRRRSGVPHIERNARTSAGARAYRANARRRRDTEGGAE